MAGRMSIIFTCLLGIVLFTAPLTALSEENFSMLAVGTKAPNFSLEGYDGQTVSLSYFRDMNYVVLVFYPEDFTPVCTQQLCALKDNMSLFEAKNAKVFGINPAGVESHKAFAEKNSLNFPLLIDPGSGVTGLYGCQGSRMSKRTVYVIDPKGIIIYAKRGNPDTAEILKAIPDPGSEGGQSN